MRTRVIVTGASGNVGRALLRKLAAADADYEIHGIARRIPPRTDVYRIAQWHQVDLADPKAVTRLQRLFRKAHCVVHLAWAFQPTRDPRYMEAVGISGSAAVLIAAHAAAVNHLVHLSSAATYAAAPGRRVDESWSTAGISTSAYSRAKSAVEELFDDYDRKGDGVAIARMRPGLIVQREAAASIRRQVFPAYLDPRWLRLLPILPLDGSLHVPVIHADDVADACVKAIERRAVGAFNLSAEPPVGRDDIARAFGAIAMPFPARLMRPLVQASWRAGLQPLDAGSLDLTLSMPLLNTERARGVLDWCPQWMSLEALAGLAQGLLHGQSPSPVLASRSVIGGWRDLSRGSNTRREEP
jgi:UDP-glucose 4-epimerase